MNKLTKTATALHERLKNNNNKTSITMKYNGTILTITRLDENQIHVTDGKNIEFTTNLKNVANFLNNFSTILNNPTVYHGYFKHRVPTEDEYYAQLVAEELEREKELEETYQYDIEY